MAVIIGFTALHLWVQGYFYIMGKDTAPGGEWSVTLYSRAMGTGGNNLPWVRGGYSYIARNADKRRGEYRQWSKDGRMLLIYYCMEDETEGYFWYDVEKWDTVAEVEMK